MRIQAFFRGRLYICGIILFTCIAETPDVLAQQQQPPVVLENSIVRFEFEPEYMGLSAMIDLRTGRNHINPVQTKHELWELTFANGTQRSTLSSTETPCTAFTIEHNPDGSGKVVIVWENIDYWRENDAFTVRVTIDLPPESGIASWRIWVDNRSDVWGLWDVAFPKFNGYLVAKEYDIALPGGNWGKLMKNCNERLSFNYPTGWNMPMQFMCAIKDGRGIYMAAHDPEAWKKDLTVSPGHEFSIRTYAEDMAVPGSDHEAPFPVMVGIYDGGWMKACKLYREFALTAPWTSKGKVSERKDMPQALKDIGLWMRVRGDIGPEGVTAAEKNKALIDAQKYFDVPLAVHWYDWHVIEYDNHYPHYFPEKPGFRDRFQDLVSRGWVVMPYINGRIVDTFNDDFHRFLPHTVKDQAGKPFPEVYGSGSGRMTVMCPYTEFWQNEVTDVVDRLGHDLGVNAVYIDQISAARAMLCFDEFHGHPLGGGGWWGDGYREMLKKVQDVAHSNGNNMIVTSENAAEPFMDGIDAFLIWIKRDDREIPMITAVYSGYSIYFSSPAWFQHGDTAWIMVQGRDFLWGTQNGWMQMELMDPEHAKKAAFLKSVGKYRIAGKKYLTYGELVDLIEPDNRLETVTEQWPDHWSNPREATLPVIQGAVWKADDGTLGIFLVHYLEDNATIEYTVDPARYGLDSSSDGYVITSITPEGNHVEATVPQGSIRRSDTLGPLEIRLLEIRAK